MFARCFCGLSVFWLLTGFAFGESDEWQSAVDAGRAAFEKADFGQAKNHYSTALKLARSLSDDDPRRGVSTFNMAKLNAVLGDYGRAETEARQSLAQLEKAKELPRLETARALYLLGRIYMSLGFVDRADENFDRSSKTWDNASEAGESDVAFAIDVFDAIFFRLMDQEDFLLNRRALAEFAKSLPNDDSRLILCLLKLARAEETKDDLAPIIRAVELARKIHGNQHPVVAFCLTELARYHQKKRRFDKAAAVQEEALVLWKKIFGPKHPKIGEALWRLGEIKYEQREFSAAEEYFQQSIPYRFSRLVDEDLCRLLGEGGLRDFDYDQFGGSPGLDAYLLELVRRGGPQIESFLRESVDRIVRARKDNPDEDPDDHFLEWLTALRRVQGLADPVAVVVDGANPIRQDFPILPVLEVGLKNVDTRKQVMTITAGGDYRTGRAARWRIEVFDAMGKLVQDEPYRVKQSKEDDLSLNLMLGGGAYSREQLAFGERWNTALRMADFSYIEKPGEYKLRVLYHDEVTIADEKTTAGLIVCQSPMIPLSLVRPRIAMTPAQTALVRKLLSEFDESQPVKVLAETYGEGWHKFIAPDSPAGQVLSLGWPAVPILIDELSRDTTTPQIRARVFSLLFTITGRNDPTSGLVLGDYDLQKGGWAVFGGKVLSGSSGGFGYSEPRSSRGSKIDPKIQTDLVEQWKIWKEYLQVEVAK